MPGASRFQDQAHWELQEGAFQPELLTGSSAEQGGVRTVGEPAFEAFVSRVDTIWERSKKNRDTADGALPGTDDDSAGGGRTRGQGAAFLPAPAGPRGAATARSEAGLWHFEVASRRRFWWRANEWMKSLFSWGCEQPVPDEWARAAQAASGTEQAFGWRPPLCRPGNNPWAEGSGTEAGTEGQSSQTG